MTRILLFCAAGMSTSMLVSKMKKAANDLGVEVTIEAYPEAEMQKRVDEADVVLLGPQVKFMLPKAKSIFETKGIPVEVINTMDYGMMNGEKVLKRALELSKKW